MMKLCRFAHLQAQAEPSLLLYAANVAHAAVEEQKSMMSVEKKPQSPNNIPIMLPMYQDEL